MEKTERYAQTSPQTQRLILAMQQDELNSHYIYTALAARVRDDHNRTLLEHIAADEFSHYQVWKTYTGKTLVPQKGRIARMKLTARIMGFTFAAKQMENGEELAQDGYARIVAELPETKAIIDDEERHENELMGMLDEERLKYVGSMVLGLNDALVELTGTIAGLTFALQSTRLVALSGLITGISATLSMASSEYLSAKSEGQEDALKSCIYTGIAYLVTVALLALPFLLFPDRDYALALAAMIVIVILIILFFNYYISVAKSLPFKKRFFEMAGISLTVAVISFGIGLLVKAWLGVDV